MPKIFQAFNLDYTADFPDKHPGWNTIRAALKKEGYTVMCSGDSIKGFPVSILVGAESDSDILPNIKRFFYGITSKHNLPFRSGHWYSLE